MSLPFIVFFVCAILAVLAALTLILAREPIHSALSLILVMCSLAVLYLLLGAEFIAAVQVIVYAGAIMVLFVFVIMLLNAGVEELHRLQQDRKICRPAAGYFPAARARALDVEFLHRQADCQWCRRHERISLHARSLRAALSEVSVPV